MSLGANVYQILVRLEIVSELRDGFRLRKGNDFPTLSFLLEFALKVNFWASVQIYSQQNNTQGDKSLKGVSHILNEMHTYFFPVLFNRNQNELK